MSETFVEAVARHADERPDAVALVDERERLPWRRVAAWVQGAAAWLVGAGLTRGAVVVGWLPNAAEWYLLRLACESAGLVWAPVSASLGGRELRSILTRVRPTLIVTPTRFRGRDYVAEVTEACREAGVDALRIAVPDAALLDLDGAPIRTDRATRAHETAHMLATTGSEGTPKLAVYTLAAAAERGRAQAELLKMTANDIVLAASAGTGPGKTAWLAAPLAGATVVTMPSFRAVPALELLVREGATVVAATPAQLTMLLPELSRFDVSCVRVWYTAGSVLPPAVAEQLEARTNGIVLSVYGATDFGGWAAPELDDPPAVRHRTVGRPRGNTQFRIVGPDGGEVAHGTPGEVVGRGPCCVSGYYGDPDLTRERWRDGWFRTQDIGCLDEHGNLVILGRVRDMIVRGGDNVAPEEIEFLLRSHPGVAEVAVVGIPDAILGERVCACVVPAPGPPPTLEALREHLRRERIAHYKLPEGLLVLSALPVVGDKLDRGALVIEAGRAARAEAMAPSAGHLPFTGPGRARRGSAR